MSSDFALVINPIPTLILCFSLASVVSGFGQTATPYLNRTLFDAQAGATNSFGFEEFNLGVGGSTGFLPTLTELGYVTFNITPNYKQEVIDGFNVGSPNNSVYLSVATDHSQTVADVTFAGGVIALGFDLKDDAGNGTAADVPQDFTINLFGAGGLSLGTFLTSTIPGGTTFTFNGFTSNTPITEMTISSTAASPNLDLVLDNFEVSAPVPEPGSLALAIAGMTGLIATSILSGRRT